jgi:hypothetical protein
MSSENQIDKKNLDLIQSSEITDQNKASPAKVGNNYFVSTTILFCFPVVLLLNQIGSNLKYMDWISFVYLGIGASVILRSYLVGFISMNLSYLSQKWSLFVLNLVLILLSLWSTYAALSDMVLTSFPDKWLSGIILSNMFFVSLIWLNKIRNSQYFQVQLLQIILSMLLLGALWQMPFAGFRWFQSLIGLVLVVFELYLLVNISRLMLHLNHK